MVDFYRDSYEGQMHPIERATMYCLIVGAKPECAVEIGTWKGGGSTYIISEALKQNGKGILHTVEANKEFYDHAMNLYNTDLKHLQPYVKFNYGSSLESYKNKFEDNEIDFLLLDGAEDARQTVKEYELLIPSISNNGIICCHDWKAEKMKDLKDILLSNHTPVFIDEKTDVGFAAFEV